MVLGQFSQGHLPARHVPLDISPSTSPPYLKPFKTLLRELMDKNAKGNNTIYSTNYITTILV